TIHNVHSPDEQIGYPAIHSGTVYSKLGAGQLCIEAPAKTLLTTSCLDGCDDNVDTLELLAEYIALVITMGYTGNSAFIVREMIFPNTPGLVPVGFSLLNFHFVLSPHF